MGQDIVNDVMILDYDMLMANRAWQKIVKHSIKWEKVDSYWKRKLKEDTKHIPRNELD